MPSFDLDTLADKLARKGIRAGAPERLAGGHIRVPVTDGARSAGLIVPATSHSWRMADNAVAWARRALAEHRERHPGIAALWDAEAAPAPDIRALHGRQEARQRSRPPAWLSEPRPTARTTPGEAVAPPTPTVWRPTFVAVLAPEAFGHAAARLAGMTLGRRHSATKLARLALPSLAAVAYRVALDQGWPVPDTASLMYAPSGGLSVVATDLNNSCLLFGGLAAPILAMLPPEAAPGADPRGFAVAVIRPSNLVSLASFTRDERRGKLSRMFRATLGQLAVLHKAME